MSRIVPAPIIGESAASGAQVIDGSLRFDDDNKNYLTRTLNTAGNNKTFTFSTWTKGLGNATFFCNGEASTGNNGLYIMITADSFYVGTWTTSWQWYVDTNRLFRDDGWYHLVVSVDTTISSPASARVKLYVNGVQETSFATANYPSQNYNTLVNNTAAHAIGRQGELDSHYLDKKLSQVYFIDGQQLGPENFGFTDPLTNTWRPKKYEGTFGTTGFYLPFDGNSPIGEDKSGIVTPNNGSIWSASLSSSSGFRSSEPKTNAFDGNTSSICSAVGSGTITFTSPVTFASNSTIRVFLHGGDHTVTVNGGSNQTISAGSFQTVTYSNSGNATFTMTFHRGGGADTGVRAIEIDGVILTDGLKGNSFTPVNFGGSVELDKATGALPILNTTQGGTQAGVGVRTDAYAQGDPNNQLSRNYSSNTTATGGFSGSYPKTNLFDGRSPADSNRAEAASNDDPINITFDPPITVSSTISLWSGKSSTRYQINDSGTYTTYSDAVGSYKDISHSGSLSNIKILHGSAGQAAGISAIKIDGTQLIDSGLFLALPLVGSTNDVSNQINSGSTTKIATSSSVDPSSTQSNFYAGSHHWSANSDTLQYAEQGTELVLGTGDFTIELWFYDDDGHNGGGGGRCYLFDNRIGGSVVGDPPTLAGWVDNSNEINLGAASTIEIQNVDTNNRWIHYAAVRSSGTVTLYIDGVAKARISDTTDYPNNGIGVGRATDGGYGWAGYIQDFRVYKGVAKYTENFIPAATSPDILPDTPSGVSGGSKLTKITDGAVSFDGSGDDLEIADSADFEFGTGDFTIECFAYHTEDSDDHLISKYGSSSANRSWRLVSDGNQKIIFYWYYSTNSSLNITSAAGKFSLNRWHHIVAQRTSGNIYLFVDGELVGSNTSSGAASEFNDNSTAVVIAGDKNGSSQDFPGYISNVRIVKGTGVYSTTGFTPPTKPLTNVTNTTLLCCQSNTDVTEGAVKPADVPWLPTGYTYWTAGMSQNWAGSGGTTSNTNDYINVALPTSGKYYWETTINNLGVYRVMGISTGAAGVGANYTDNIFGFYYNGNPPLFLVRNSSGTNRNASGVTHGASVGSPNWQNGDKIMWAWDADNDKIYMGLNGTWYNSGDPVAGTGNIIAGEDLSASSYYFKLGYTADGGTPTLTTVTSGNSGYSSSVSKEGSAAATNFNPFNTDINTVRGQETGYCTLNPIDTIVSLKDGNLETSTSSGWQSTRATIGMSSGKFYWETQNKQTAAAILGISGASAPMTSGLIFGSDANPAWAWAGANRYFNGSSAGTGLSNHSATDIVMYALDADAGKLWFGRNGTWYDSSWGSTGNPATGLNPTVSSLDSSRTYFACASFFNGSAKFNFGQKPFKFPPPDGFQPINAANVRPETVISRPTDFVGAVTYDGSGNTLQEMNVGFKPDFVWCKSITNAENHALFDSVRGSTKFLRSDSTDDEYTISNVNFTLKGFSFANGSGEICESGQSYVGLAWKAGGNKNTFNIDDLGYASAAAAGLDGGDLTVTGASVGTKQGFSIIKYTGSGNAGDSASHGLLEAPKFIITKNIDNGTYNWRVFTTVIDGSNDRLFLNETNAKADQTDAPVPTSSVFYVGANLDHNKVNDNIIAYLWHDVPGLQKFGTYTANNSSDGVYVELGFKPAILLIKNHDSTGDWIIWDNARNPSNPVNRQIWPYTTSGTYGAYDQVGSNYPLDFLSNGFKMRTTDADMNGSSRNYFYAAWAEAPSFNLYGAQSNAR